MTQQADQLFDQSTQDQLARAEQDQLAKARRLVAQDRKAAHDLSRSASSIESVFKALADLAAVVGCVVAGVCLYRWVDLGGANGYATSTPYFIGFVVCVLYTVLFWAGFKLHAIIAGYIALKSKDKATEGSEQSMARVVDSLDAREDIELKYGHGRSGSGGLSTDFPVTVTNVGTKAQSFIIKIAMVGPDGTTAYDSATVSTATLAPGKSVTQTLSFFTDSQEWPKGSRSRVVSATGI